MKFAIFLVAALMGLASASKASYDNYRVYSLSVVTQAQKDVVQAIQEYPDGYEFWGDALRSTLELIVPPHKFGDFADLVERHQFEVTMRFSNLQLVLDGETDKIQPPSAYSRSDIAKARYDNYRVYNIKIETEAQINLARHLISYPDGFLFAGDAGGFHSDLDLIVPPHKQSDFDELVSRYEITTILRTENLQANIDAENPKVQPRDNRASGYNWLNYHSVDTTYAWLDEQVAAYPNILSQHSIGLSFEGREIRAVRLQRQPGKPVIFVEAQIHAREWISQATATYLMNQLLTSNDPYISALSENFNWIFIPIANPDGVEHTHTTNRMWRKTRHTGHSAICTGTDANRNFDYMWMTGGASSNPCSETFAGPEAFSEPETSAIRDFYETVSSEVKLYLSFHAFGQWLLYPYGFTTSAPSNQADLVQIGEATKAAIATRYGTVYVHGNIATTLYIASGSSIDWAMGVYDTPLSFVFEFRDTGTNGFTLPASEIIPNSVETIDGIVALVREAQSLGYLQ